MKNQYQYSLLKKILATRVGKVFVWKKRIKLQTQFLHLLEESLDTDISTQSFGFYPGQLYFATSLTADPDYTKKMKPTWHKIKSMLQRMEYTVYAPFDISDPHQKIPDNLNSQQIRDLDHIKVLQAEVALMDLNRPSHGVGQEIEMGMFVPKIGFANVRVSRMSKGMPGMLVLRYKDEKELQKILREIFTRKDFKTQPFYIAKCLNQATLTIFKGKDCLHCVFAQYLHEV